MSLSQQRKSVTVAIGLPAFNDKPYLGLALRSIFAQTFRDWELIIIDDGSSDCSSELLHGLHDERVRVIANGQHLGLGARLNQIVQLARGRYIAGMDADDLMHPLSVCKPSSTFWSIIRDFATTLPCYLRISVGTTSQSPWLEFRALVPTEAELARKEGPGRTLR